MKARIVLLVLSALTIIGGGAMTVMQGGFNFGIDFQAGLSVTIEVGGDRAVTTNDVRIALQDRDGISVQRIGDENSRRFVVRVRDDGSADFQTRGADEVVRRIGAGLEGVPITELETAFVGPQLSQDLARQAIGLTLFALALILVYLWFRFRIAYALASITALLHDVAVILVVIGTFQFEVSTATVAAVLTIIGYSLNDTIVIFDRIRENEQLMHDARFRQIVNASVRQSLTRTLVTSLTTLLAVTPIIVLATGTIQLFALKLAVGVVVGTYSSIFVAAPTLMGLQRMRVARRAAKQRRNVPKSVGSQAKNAPVSAVAGGATASTADAVVAAKREIAARAQAKKKKQRR